jgi:hypothetical protein
MRIYIGFDDTDTTNSDRGTGKLARWFEDELPESCKLWGVVRQQLLMDDAIPFTTHNSAACVIIETPERSLLDELISRAVKHIEHHFIQGSDPGLCATHENHPALSGLVSFGRACTRRVVTQAEAFQAASGVHLSGHGGTNDGIIGAAAAVGLTAYGWGGRFIELGRLREFPGEVQVSALEQAGIAVVSIDRDAEVLFPEDVVDTRQWLRPRLWGGYPVLPVAPKGNHLWKMVGERKRNQAN